ncbi:MAG: hypothetical protein GVY22_05250 [Gammaproteobacteria bacterium]|jgi:Flp pilus assembly pilin Flp|nr:hypothetical protein [Gammaproteobacteria bacterium]
MSRILRMLWDNEQGAEFVEWILVAAVIVAMASGALGLLGDQVDATINGVGSRLQEPLE